MKSPVLISVSVVCLLNIISWNGSAAYVSVDDCDEPGAHRYHAHAQQSSSSTGYSQTHPAPSGYRATSSSYMRSGNAGNSAAYTQDVDGDLQTAQSVYSPSVTKVGSSYQDSGTGGYGLYRSHNEEASSYGSRSPSYAPASTGYAPVNTGYAPVNTGYASVNTGYAASSDSHVRQKFERLKSEADAFVHNGAPPPAGGVGSVPIGSQVRQGGRSSASSQYQQSSARYGSTGNVLGVSYGTTGTEEEDNSQKLIPVAATLPASGALVGAHKESHDSAISYSTSGVAPPTDGVDFSISHNTPLAAAHASSSQQSFETLKQKAEAFVHQGGPPPAQISAGHVATADALTQQSTRVETLPVKHTDRNTLIVPVRVTVTREHTVLPDGAEQQYYDQTGGLSSSQSSSYSNTRQSSASSSGALGAGYQAGSTVGYVQPSLGSSSSYSYNAQASKVPPKVYTVGTAGSINFPESNSLVESSTTSYGSSYSKQTRVRQENVVVPGAVQLINEEEAQRRSNKLFDLVSGYGTFLPAKEEEAPAVDVKNAGASSSYSSSAQTSQSGVNSGYQSGVSGVSQLGVDSGYESGVGTGYQSGVYRGSQSGVGGGYQSGVYRGSQSGVGTGSQSGVSGVSQLGVDSGYQSGVYRGSQSGAGTGYQSGVRGGYESGIDEDYQTRVSGAGGGSYSSRTSGVYQGVPAGTIRKTSSVYSSYNSNQGTPTIIGPGIPLGDPLSPPEVSGSYFTSGGAGGKHAYNSNYASQSNYGTSGGYGGGYGYNKDYSKDSQVTIPVLCDSVVCESANIIPDSTGNVNKYGISSSWSSKSQTVNGKTTESKQAVVTVNDNGKVDTYATHTR